MFHEQNTPFEPFEGAGAHMCSNPLLCFGFLQFSSPLVLKVVSLIVFTSLLKFCDVLYVFFMLAEIRVWVCCDDFVCDGLLCVVVVVWCVICYCGVSCEHGSIWCSWRLFVLVLAERGVKKVMV